jgi:hypothetical protein
MSVNSESINKKYCERNKISSDLKYLYNKYRINKDILSKEIIKLIERISCVEYERDNAYLMVTRSNDKKNQRLMDLVRYCRGTLFENGLIDEKEYADLVADSENGQRVARLME